MKEVVAYCRVACAKQSDPSAEVQRQEQMVRRYADARGLIICETYLDAGVSGGTLERPALQSLLADCRAGKIGTVITQISTMQGMQSFCPAHIAFCGRATGKLRLHHISANETCNLR